MIKSWVQFIREFVENSDSVIDAKMEELNDLVSNLSDGNNIMYQWENKENSELVVNFLFNDLSIRYEFNIKDLKITKVVGENIDFSTNIDSIDEGLDIIEKDMHNILGISEKKGPGRPKAGRTKSGRKVPGKYLTKNRKLMKKEIEEFQGKDSYKTKWDADYKSGKGGEGKRHQTKKSAATKAYQRMFGNKEK